MHERHLDGQNLQECRKLPCFSKFIILAFTTLSSYQIWTLLLTCMCCPCYDEHMPMCIKYMPMCIKHKNIKDLYVWHDWVVYPPFIDWLTPWLNKTLYYGIYRKTEKTQADMPSHIARLINHPTLRRNTYCVLFLFRQLQSVDSSSHPVTTRWEF